MDRRLGTTLLFKLVVFVYFSTLGVILFKVHSDTLNELFKNGEHESKRVNHTIEIVNNVTRYVYLNNTIVVYRDSEEQVARYGPGENGTKTEFVEGTLSKHTLDMIKQNRKFHGFNTFVSDIVSLHRKVPDMRPQVCKDKVYPKDMPRASVVIIFRDEWHSILLRTAYSILETSPPELLKEVILVDDGSENSELKARVAIHVAAVEKFKLVVNKEPLGLMMARQKGIEAASAEYFVVMDGHMEVGPGWLEPLISRLLEEPKACLCSHVGAILQDNLMYKVDDPSNTFFDSQFPFFDPLTLDQQWAWYRDSYRKQRNGSLEPLEYGTIQGMMTAMRKDFFMQLGGFDPGMKVWGTEQMELSIKVWMCGGRVEMIPCSKVAHMYRNTPWGKVNVSSDHGSANKRRMLEVWMDEPYKGFVMDYIRNRKYETGDLEDRHRIRRENNCKPYSFYVEKVRELSDIFFPKQNKARRTVINKEKNRCLDFASKPNKTDSFYLILYQCHGNSNQNLILTETEQIRASAGLLLTVTANANMTELMVIKSPTNHYGEESYWKYQSDDTIYNIKTELCLTALTYEKVDLQTCTGSINQQWKWERIETV